MSRPEPPASGSQLLSVSLDQNPSVLAELRQLLNDEERRRADAFHFETDRQRWTAARAALRIALGRWTGKTPDRVAITVDAQGKPHLAHSDASVHFNLSHSGNFALIALSNQGPLGIDIEPKARGVTLISCATAFLSPNELTKLGTIENREDRARHLITTWCAKEAYLKALGSGLSIPPETLSLEKVRDGSFLIMERGRRGRFQIHFPDPGPIPGSIAALALPYGMYHPEIEPIDLIGRHSA